MGSHGHLLKSFVPRLELRFPAPPAAPAAPGAPIDASLLERMYGKKLAEEIVNFQVQREAAMCTSLRETVHVHVYPNESIRVVCGGRAAPLAEW